MYIRMRHKKPTTKQRNEIKKMLTELLVCLCMYIIIGANKRRSKYDFLCQSRASLPALFLYKEKYVGLHRSDYLVYFLRFYSI